MTNWQYQAGQLWHYHWKRTLADSVGVDKLTVQRWNTGELAIPSEIVEKINQTYNIWRGE